MAGKNSFKKGQFEERILNEANLLLRTSFNNPRLQFVSITKVELSFDFAYADLYWDTFDASNRGAVKKAIESVAGKMRSELAKKLSVRFVPDIRFTYDSQFEAEKEIDDLLSKEAELGKKF